MRSRRVDSGTCYQQIVCHFWCVANDKSHSQGTDRTDRTCSDNVSTAIPLYHEPSLVIVATYHRVFDVWPSEAIRAYLAWAYRVGSLLVATVLVLVEEAVMSMDPPSYSHVGDQR
jgi:hypothetical protein